MSVHARTSTMSVDAQVAALKADKQRYEQFYSEVVTRPLGLGRGGEE